MMNICIRATNLACSSSMTGGLSLTLSNGWLLFDRRFSFQYSAMIWQMSPGMECDCEERCVRSSSRDTSSWKFASRSEEGLEAGTAPLSASRTRGEPAKESLELEEAGKGLGSGNRKSLNNSII